MPPIRGYLLVVGKSLLAADCVVADAVTVEPVSTPKFPANREINREFCRIRPLTAILKADTRANSEAYSRIPCSTEQGIFTEEQEISWREQGISIGKSTERPPTTFSQDSI
jgi:hypothetical protein